MLYHDIDMDLDHIVKKIDEASKKVFNIAVPIDDMSFYMMDRSKYIMQSQHDLSSEMAWTVLQDLSTVTSDVWEHTFNEIQATLAYHQPKLNSEGKLASDITVFTNIEVQNPLEDRYKQFERVAHEIGHALQLQMSKRGIVNNYAVKKQAELLGQINAQYRLLNGLLTEEEKKTCVTQFLVSREGNKEAANNQSLIYALQTISGSGDQLLTAKDLEVNIIYLQSLKDEIEHDAKMRELFRNPAGSSHIYDYEYDSIMEKARKICEESDDGRIQDLEKKITDGQNKLKQIEEENQRRGKISIAYSKIKDLTANLGKHQKRFGKYLGSNAIDAEGWAVYYASKIMEYMVWNDFSEKNPSITDISSAKARYQDNPNDGIFSNTPVLRVHTEALNEWRSRNDKYGVGFRVYEGNHSPSDAVTQALDKK